MKRFILSAALPVANLADVAFPVVGVEPLTIPPSILFTTRHLARW